MEAPRVVPVLRLQREAAQYTKDVKTCQNAHLQAHLALWKGFRRWILPFSHDNMQAKSLVDQMADEEMGADGRFAQLRVLLLQLDLAIDLLQWVSIAFDGF